MPPQDSHLSDQELILTADGELNPRRNAHVRSHLAACWQCRTRLRNMENAIADFVELHSAALNRQLPPVSRARALLKAQLADLRPQASSLRWNLAAQPAFALALAAAALVVFVYLWSRPTTGSIPLRQLTPGAVRSVAKSDVCTAGQNRAFVVPVALQRRVFEEYGIRDVPPNAYEVDYLITPELGGSSDIRNLWPEPYSSTVWNAHVKDELEDRLHRMVCDGQIDLATAQHEIATDWIGAYKKYFNSSRPREN